MDSNAPNHKELFHKKKEAKKKLKTEGLLPIGLLDYSSIGLGYHTSQEPIEQGSIDQQDKSQQQKTRTRTQILNHEIDIFLSGLVNEGLISESFIPFFAKACHTLSINSINRLAINARNGKKPQNLFAYKVKGAMALHYKQEYYATTPETQVKPID